MVGLEVESVAASFRSWLCRVQAWVWAAASLPCAYIPHLENDPGGLREEDVRCDPNAERVFLACPRPEFIDRPLLVGQLSLPVPVSVNTFVSSHFVKMSFHAFRIPLWSGLGAALWPAGQAQPATCFCEYVSRGQGLASLPCAVFGGVEADGAAANLEYVLFGLL